jgi:Activator of mitotic machinery Cdc14 phosphatase activation C-term
MTSPTGVLERSPSMPVIDVDSLAPLEADKTRTSAPAILEQLEGQNLPRPTSDVILQQQQQQQADPFLEENQALLGQVQPRHNRRPPLRRQTAETPPTLLLPSRSPTKDQTSPTQIEDRPLKKSPVSPSFTSPQQSPTDYITSPEPEQPQFPPPPPRPPSSPSPPPTQSKKGAWSRLFNTSSDDEQVKEKPSTKGKPKKSASLVERSRPSEKSDTRQPEHLDRSKSLIEQSSQATPPSPVEPPVTPQPPAPQPKPSKKESGLFASLFGSKKKSDSKEKQKPQDPPSKTPTSTDKAQYQRFGQTDWPGGATPGGPPILNFYYTRFPIHIERAIYRLSHIKLANPRRPLLQQVLLSNFMYGYLNLINKTTQPSPPAQQEVVTQPYPGEYAESAQGEEHVFYSSDEQVDYYGQDYYGGEYEDEQDDVPPSPVEERLIVVCSAGS